MATLKALRQRLQETEALVGRVNNLTRALVSGKQLAQIEVSDYRGRKIAIREDYFLRYKARDKLIHQVLPGAKTINGDSNLSRVLKRVIRKMFEPEYHLYNLNSGYASGVAFALANSPLSFSGKLLREAILLNKGTVGYATEPSGIADVLHAYYLFLFRIAGVLDNLSKKFLGTLFGSPLSDSAVHYCLSSQSPSREGCLDTTQHQVLPFPQSFRRAIYSMARRDYIGPQGYALAAIVYFRQIGFVPTLMDLFATNTSLFTAPSEVQRQVTSTWWPDCLNDDPTDYIVNRLRTLALALYILTGNNKFYELYENSIDKHKTYLQPYSSEFMAKMHAMAVKLIPSSQHL